MRIMKLMIKGSSKWKTKWNFFWWFFLLLLLIVKKKNGDLQLKELRSLKKNDEMMNLLRKCLEFWWESVVLCHRLFKLLHAHTKRTFSSKLFFCLKWNFTWVILLGHFLVKFIVEILDFEYRGGYGFGPTRLGLDIGWTRPKQRYLMWMIAQYAP